MPLLQILDDSDDEDNDGDSAAGGEDEQQQQQLQDKQRAGKKEQQGEDGKGKGDTKDDEAASAAAKVRRSSVASYQEDVLRRQHTDLSDADSGDDNPQQKKVRCGVGLSRHGAGHCPCATWREPCLVPFHPQQAASVNAAGATCCCCCCCMGCKASWHDAHVCCRAPTCM